MASVKEKRLEIVVGIFGVISVLVVVGIFLNYGKLGQRLRPTYRIIAEVNDATGIRSGVPVRLGGFPIGMVASNPQLKADYTGMQIPLSIYKTAQIPEGASFSISTVGLMGDKFIKIRLPENPNGQFLKPEQVVVGSSASILDLAEADLDGLFERMNSTFSEVSSAIEEMNQLMTSVQSITTEDNIQRFNKTLENLSESSEKVNQATTSLTPTLASLLATIQSFEKVSNNLSNSSEKLDPMIESANNTLSEVNRTARSANQLISSFDATVLDDLEGTLSQVDQTLLSVNGLVNQVNSGDGLLQDVIDNPTFKNDVINLVDKVERRGFLCYPKTKKKRKKSRIIATPVNN